MPDASIQPRAHTHALICRLLSVILKRLDAHDEAIELNTVNVKNDKRSNIRLEKSIVSLVHKDIEEKTKEYTKVMDQMKTLSK